MIPYARCFDYTYLLDHNNNFQIFFFVVNTWTFVASLTTEWQRRKQKKNDENENYKNLLNSVNIDKDKNYSAYHDMAKLVNSNYVFKCVLEDSHRHDAIDDLLELLNGYH